MEIKKALDELRKEKKRKFVQAVDLVVNLKDFDVRKEALNSFINLPHPIDKKIGAFLTKRSKLVDTISEDDFIKYKELKDIKKLAKNYDLFIAVAPMMAKIATKFGRVFGPTGKMPSPQAGIIPKDDEESVKNMLEKMKKVIRIRTKEMSIKVSVGKEDMKDEEIIENIESVINQLKKLLPRKIDNIKNAMVKFTMTKSIKFFDRTPKRGEEINGVSLQENEKVENASPSLSNKVKLKEKDNE